MTFNTQTITIAGRRLIASALVAQGRIEYTRIVVGNGSGPDVPEELESLVAPLFELPIRNVYADIENPGAYVVSTSFSPSGTQGDFELREVGVYARLAAGEDSDDGEEREDVLIAYLNAEDTADFVHQSSGVGLTQIDLNISVVVGNADVLIVSDPNASATLQDIENLKREFKEEIDEFEKGSLDDLKKDIEDATRELKAAKEQINETKDGYVLKKGDSMSGDLEMTNGARLLGDVRGSAEKWNGWIRYDDISNLVKNETTCTIAQIVAAMATPSQLLCSYANTTANTNFPEKMGLLEVRKSSEMFASVLFTSFTGQAYQGGVYNGSWLGWRTVTAIAPGSWMGYAGATAPAGWLLCQGQTLSTTTYAALFAAIGYTYGGSGSSFKLPDFRGYFIRGYDAGAGRDAGRKLGSTQESGAPNISGLVGVTPPYIKAISQYPLETDGAFYATSLSQKAKAAIHVEGWSYGNINFSASRSSNVYKSGLTETRPTNIAQNYIIKY